MKPIAIIGGGIGGLTTALVLKQQNIPFVLYEAASEIRAIGAGILLANNAMQVFKQLYIDHQIREKGNGVEAIHITRADFSILSGVDLSKLELEEGLHSHAIHRADLHHLLSEAVGHEHIVLNKRFIELEKSEHDYQLCFEDGTTKEAEYIIGADGIKSKVRELVFGQSSYRNAKQICWRGVLDFQLPGQYPHQALETWGKGTRFGFVQISKDNVYWYLVINAGLENPSAKIVDYTKGFNALATLLVQQTPQENIIKGPLYDLKPISIWTKGRISLLGDAAHATTPNLGQGACQATEDAYVLGQLIKRFSVADALQKYPEIRRAKAHNVVNTSWRIGIISQLENPMAMALRNFGMKYLTSKKITIKQMKKLFTLDEII